MTEQQAKEAFQTLLIKAAKRMVDRLTALPPGHQDRAALVMWQENVQRFESEAAE